MYKVLFVIFFIVTILLVILIILQQGRGIGIGNSFGNSVSNILFGSSNSNTFLIRAIAILTALFFIISLVLSHINNIKFNKENKLESLNKLVKSKETKFVFSPKTNK